MNNTEYRFKVGDKVYCNLIDDEGNLAVGVIVAIEESAPSIKILYKNGAIRKSDGERANIWFSSPSFLKLASMNKVGW